eukprot:161915_1
MSDIEESDLENVAFKKRKNGYTYYGKSDNTASCKLVLSIFLISITFLCIGSVAGYYYGFDQLQLLQGYNTPIANDPYIPNIPDINVDIDPFDIFMRGGIRYGGDYGYDTINNPVTVNRENLGLAHRRLVDAGPDDEEKQKKCANRRCCHPVNGDSPGDASKCKGKSLKACCALEAKDICDWNCAIDIPNVNKNHKVRGKRKRNKLCAGHDPQNGKFIGDKVNKDPPDTGKPKNKDDLKKRDGLLNIDKCGDVFSDDMDDETAEDEMKHDDDKKDEERPPADDGTGERRRMKVIGDDSREQMTQRGWPQDQLGLVTFSSGSSSYICSGTKVNYKHILTSGHCCHSGGSSGNWYGNWKWYPGATQKYEINGNGRSTRYATAFNGWVRDRNRDYDICWITLSQSYYGWFGFGYHTGINTQWSFDMWGYPGDKYAGPGIKWGDRDCHADYAITTNQLKYTCDTAGGQSGSGLYTTNGDGYNEYVYSWIVWCVHAFASISSNHNGCARITADKFQGMYDNMIGQGGWNP